MGSLFRLVCSACPVCSLRSRITQSSYAAYKLTSVHLYSRAYAWSRVPSCTISTSATLSDQDGVTSPENQHDGVIDPNEFPIERIRNFSIIAHVDHGKSTLADRLLELTGAISDKVKNEQVLDKLQVERERGITVKAQTASLVHTYRGERYLLNLIDTPGHVDFNYEVARSLSACQGVILLIDANHGIQAQTMANFYLAFEADLAILPAINKIDLKVARTELVAEQIEHVFDIPNKNIYRISAKNGTGVLALLDAVIENIPAPAYQVQAPFQALMFDFWFDHFKGAVANIAVKAGSVRKGDKIMTIHSKKKYEVQDVGILNPDHQSTGVLFAGQVGYLVASIKNPKDALVGDTFCHVDNVTEPLLSFKEAKPMVFAGVFPLESSEFNNLKKAIDKMLLNDSSIQVSLDSSAVLGQGWRLGFLGLLHMEVFSQRLEQEFDANILITTPNVPYKVKIHGAKNIKFYKGEMVTVLNTAQMPNLDIISEFHEPYVLGTIITPDEYIGHIMSMLMDCRAEQIEQSMIDNTRVMFKAMIPLNEVVVDFFDDLKSATSGYASFDYEDQGFRQSDLVKIDICLNGKDVDEMSQISHVSKAVSKSKSIVAKLKESLPRQLFEIAVQAKVRGKVLARENVKAFRKDVTAKCYGGDISRKNKLLKAQAEGKKKLRRIGNIDVPKETFIKIITNK